MSTNHTEGYVFAIYGTEKYLHHAVAAAFSIRRHDKKRPIALYCTLDQKKRLEETELAGAFALIDEMPENHRSIVGLKHHVDKFMPFERNLLMDADMILCKNPDPLWQQLAAFPFTITGIDKADFWFAGPKGAGIFIDYFLDRRRKTMRHFGLSHLPRVQSGLIYAQNQSETAKICETAREYLSRRPETHFRSRLTEGGRVLETCEWSLAMSMSHHKTPIFPWFQGHNSAQLDFIDGLTDYDPDFKDVAVDLYCDPFINSLRGIPNEKVRRRVTKILSAWPGKGDLMKVTPFVIHFGWLHQKQPFYDFADRVWEQLIADPSLLLLER